MATKILPYLNVLEVDTVDISNVNRFIVIDENEDVKAVNVNNTTIPYCEFKYPFTGTQRVEGDWDAVWNAIQNKRPFIVNMNVYGIKVVLDLFFPLQNNAQFQFRVITFNGETLVYTSYNVNVQANGTYTGEVIETIIETEIPTLFLLTAPSSEYDIEMVNKVYDSIINSKPHLLYGGDESGWNVIDYITYNEEYIICYDISIDLTKKKIWSINKSTGICEYTEEDIDLAYLSDLATKQNLLVSGTNIKTINNESILGSGNITITGGVTQQQMEDYVNTQIGGINAVLEEIIG